MSQPKPNPAVRRSCAPCGRCAHTLRPLVRRHPNDRSGRPPALHDRLLVGRSGLSCSAYRAASLGKITAAPRSTRLKDCFHGRLTGRNSQELSVIHGARRDSVDCFKLVENLCAAAMQFNPSQSTFTLVFHAYAIALFARRVGLLDAGASLRTGLN